MCKGKDVLSGTYLLFVSRAELNKAERTREHTCAHTPVRKCARTHTDINTCKGKVLHTLANTHTDVCKDALHSVFSLHSNMECTNFILCTPLNMFQKKHCVKVPYTVTVTAVMTYVRKNGLGRTERQKKWKG